MLQTLLAQLVLINGEDVEVRRVSVQTFGRRHGGVAEGTSAVSGSSSLGDWDCHLILPAPFPWRALLALRFSFTTCGMPQRGAV